MKRIFGGAAAPGDLLRTLVRDEHGNALVEYAVIFSVLSLLVYLALGQFGSAGGTAFNTAGQNAKAVETVVP